MVRPRATERLDGDSHAACRCSGVEARGGPAGAPLGPRPDGGPWRCRGYHVYQDDGDENALYRTVLAIIETASEPPDIRFDTARRGRQRQAAGGGRPREYANAAAGAAAGS